MNRNRLQLIISTLYLATSTFTTQTAEQPLHASEALCINKRSSNYKTLLDIIVTIDNEANDDDTVVKKLTEIFKTAPAGIDLDFTTMSKHFTPLMLACQHNLPKVVDFLCQKGANPNTCARYKSQYETDTFRLPIEIASSNNKNPEIGETLLRYGATPTILLPNGQSLLQNTLLHANLLSPDGDSFMLINKLVNHKAKFCSSFDGAECLEVIVNMHLNSNLINQQLSRITRLFYTILNIDRDKNHLYLSTNPQPSGRPATSPLSIALRANHFKLVSTMLSFTNDKTQIPYMLKKALLQETTCGTGLINNIANDFHLDTFSVIQPIPKEVLEYQDAAGNTPLLCALHCGQNGNEAAKFLIESGAPLDVINKNNETPLLVARRYGSSQEIIKLLEGKFKPNEKTLKSDTGYIMLTDNVEMLKQIVSYGDMFTSSLLTSAICLNATKCTQYILDNIQRFNISEELLTEAFIYAISVDSLPLDAKIKFANKLLETGHIIPSKHILIEVEGRTGSVVTPIDALLINSTVLQKQVVGLMRKLLQMYGSFNLNYTSKFDAYAYASGCTEKPSTKVNLSGSPLTICLQICHPDLVLDLLNLFIRHGADIDYMPDNAGTALFTATMHNDVEATELLLANNASVHIVNGYGETLLHVLAYSKASTANATNFICKFIQRGIDIQHKDICGETAMNVALKYKNTPFAEALAPYLTPQTGTIITQHKAEQNSHDTIPATPVRHDRIPAQPQEPTHIKQETVLDSSMVETSKQIDPLSLLIHAIQSDERDYSIADGIDINAYTDKKNNTALHRAIKLARLEWVDFLLINKARTNIPNQEGETAWTLALEDTTILNLFMKHTKNKELSDLDNIDAHGNSLIHAAVYTHNYQALLILCTNFMQEIRRYIESHNSQGLTPLIIAIKEHDKFALETLLEKYNADPNTQSKEGRSPLLFAIKKNDLDIIKTLLAHGAYARCSDRNGNNALHYASIYASQDSIIDLLQAYGCDIAQTNAAGETPGTINSLGNKKPTARIKAYIERILAEQLKQKSREEKKQKSRKPQSQTQSSYQQSPKAQINTQDTEKNELQHNLSKEELTELYKKCIEQGNVAMLLEFSIDFVQKEITTQAKIAETIDRITQKSSSAMSPRLQVIDRSQSTFQTKNYDILLGGHSHLLEQNLEYLIANEKEAIQISCYCITNPTIYKALLLAATKHNVKIEIILDSTCYAYAWQLLEHLKQHSINVYAISGRESRTRMHNKYALFHSQQIVWTGSPNFTIAGLRHNHESALICREPAIFYKFCKNFNMIAAQIAGYQPITAINQNETPAEKTCTTANFTNLRALLIKLIRKENSQITIAAYMVNDPLILQELNKALEHKPNLHVTIIVDDTTVIDPEIYSNLKYHGEKGFELIRYKAEKTELMHYKCIVFTDQRTVIFGSANITEDALTDKNYENLVVIQDTDDESSTQPSSLIQFCLRYIFPFLNQQ